MKIFDDIENALNYTVDIGHPVECKVFFKDDKTGGLIFECYPSRNYEKRGFFSGLHHSDEVWNSKTKRWEPANEKANDGLGASRAS